MNNALTSLEAVYYSGQVPDSLESLTFLGLVFDKIHFPGVYIPSEGVDVEATKREMQRIAALGGRDVETIQLLNCMAYALNMQYLKDFCVFTGKCGGLGTIENESNDLARVLEEAIYGPPPEGFYPTIAQGFAKELPGGEGVSINGPGWIMYPANAFVYAAKNGLVLVNDNPDLPMPSLGGMSLKGDAQALATIMALESIRLVLPQIRALTLPELAEFRTETKDIVRPFRRSMLRLSKDLHALITSASSPEDVQNEARLIAQTTVLPDIEELRQSLARSARPWSRQALDLAKAVPELVVNFVTMPTTLAAAKVFIKLAELCAGEAAYELEKEQRLQRSGFHYLLRIEKAIGRGA